MKIKPGAIISNRYEIIEQIGSGGMSIVYKAKDRKLGRVVTFKVLRSEYVKDVDFIKRFEVEARAAASLSHPNIVNVYDVGHDGLVNYIVMEYIDGVTLKEVIKRRAPFSNDETLGVAIQIASALAHAHNHNIVHRDIKPQNILVTANGVIKVTDFGIAKAVGSKTITVANNTMGSVHYFSPEQAKGGYVSFKSDIYSLGLVMFEMATGKLPFDGDTPVSIAIKQINEFLPDMKEINPNVSDKLQKIVSRATEKFASRRYGSTEELENDLKRAIVNQVEDDSQQEFDMQQSPTIQLTSDDIAKIKKETSLPMSDEDDFYDMEYEMQDKGKEKKVVVAAVITSVVIILLISFFGYKIFFGHTPVQVPQLVGKSLEEANEIAKSLGVKVKEVGTEYSSEVEKDKISSQNYSSGDNLYKGDTIDIKISLGVEQVVMPNVLNKDLMDAYNSFKDYSFDVDEVYEYSSTIPSNVVISQSPSYGTMVDENAKIVLRVSKGQEIKNVTVPNIVGLSESDAKIKLQDSELTVGAVTRSESKKYAEGTVITQTVSAGKEVQSGTVVNFVVSSGSSNSSAVSKPTPTKKVEPIAETKILTVDPANIPSDAKTVKLKILKVGANGAETFYENEVSTDKLPLKFNITKENEGEYQIYLIDADGNSSYQGSSSISFE